MTVHGKLTAAMCAAVLALGLAACGGGGGSGGGGNGSPRIGNAGGDAADTYLASDILYLWPDGLGRFETQCQGSTCRFNDGEDVVPFSLDDYGPGNPTNRVETPTLKNGVPLARARNSRDIGFGPMDVTLYGGWLDHSGFAVVHGFVDDADRGPLGIQDLEVLMSVSSGAASQAFPQGGRATWRGAMVGFAVDAWSGQSPGAAPGGTPQPAPAEQSDEGLVHGDAAVEANFSEASVDVRFTDIVHVDTGTATGRHELDRPSLERRNLPRHGASRAGSTVPSARRSAGCSSATGSSARSARRAGRHPNPAAAVRRIKAFPAVLVVTGLVMGALGAVPRWAPEVWESGTVTKRKRRVRQPEVVINASFAADRRDTGDRFSIWAVLTIVLIGFGSSWRSPDDERQVGFRPGPPRMP